MLKAWAAFQKTKKEKRMQKENQVGMKRKLSKERWCFTEWTQIFGMSVNAMDHSADIHFVKICSQATSLICVQFIFHSSFFFALNSSPCAMFQWIPPFIRIQIDCTILHADGITLHNPVEERQDENPTHTHSHVQNERKRSFFVYLERLQEWRKKTHSAVEWCDECAHLK